MPKRKSAFRTRPNICFVVTLILNFIALTLWLINIEKNMTKETETTKIDIQQKKDLEWYGIISILYGTCCLLHYACNKSIISNGTSAFR